MKLLWDSSVKLFYTESSYHERHIPKQAGFIWNKLKRNHWATQDANKARQLASWADPACQTVLLEQLKKQAELMELSSATDADANLPSPEGLEYYGFQKAGILFALKKRRTLIADEMGLGKTIQAIGVINAKPDIKKVLVITKASLRLNWQRELERWLTRPMSIGLAIGSSWPSTDVVVINYDILTTHKKNIDAVKWDLLVIDEAHFIKNPKAKRTAMVLGRLPKREGEKSIPEISARYVTALTGSPIENRPIEIYGLLKFLDPGSWSSFWKFAQRYCDATRNLYGWDFTGSSNRLELQERLRQTVMVRRLKKDVLKDLPRKRYQIIEIPVEDDELKAILQKEWDEWQERMDKIKELRKAMEAAKTSGDTESFRQHVSELKESIKVEFEEFSIKRHATGLRKLPYIIEYLKEIMDESPHKMLVFGHHRDVLQSLQREFPDSVLVTGEIQPNKRQALIDSFQNNPDIKFFFGSIGAAGVGLNLTAASHVVFVEEDVVPERMTQAEDRAHRIGQTESVLITHVVLERSLDGYMAKIAARKARIIDVILGTPENNGDGISTEGWGKHCPKPEKPIKSVVEEDICPF